MTNVAKVLRELKAEPGKNAKLAILAKHKGDRLLTSVLQAALDPYTTYFIKKIPEYKPSTKPTVTLEQALDRLSMYTTRTVTGQKAIDFLAATLNSMSADDAFVYERVIEKDLDCGVQESSVNKVWKNLIPTYPCLLAKGYDEDTIANIDFPAYSQLKLDGMRVNIFNDGGVITFRGRSGKALDLLGVLDKEILKILPDGKVLDGELILVESDGTHMPRKKGNGILNKAIKGTISEKEARMVRAIVWDVIPIKDFFNAKCNTPYTKRFAELKTIVKGNYVSIVENREVNSLDEAIEHFEETLRRGEEGTLLKNRNHIWEDKRSKHLIKMKAEKDADLVVVDWIEGTGKYAGMMGAAVCQSSDGLVEVSIGGGWSDKQRKELTREKIMGKILTVLYNERIKSKEKGREHIDSLFLPRVVEIREDKNVANSSKEIK